MIIAVTIARTGDTSSSPYAIHGPEPENAILMSGFPTMTDAIMFCIERDYSILSIDGKEVPAVYGSSNSSP